MATADTARLVAQLTLDDKGFTKGLTNAEKKLGQFESTSYRVGQNIGNGLKSASHNLKILGAVAAGAIATQVVAGVRSLEDLERVQNATEAVIKSTGGAAGQSAKQIRDMAEALEAVTTADDKAIQEGENLLLTFTNIGEKTFPRATEAMVDLSIAMADGDVEAADFGATALQLGKALNDPVKGISALTRVGVSFTKEQKEQIKAMTEAGDVAGAQAIILDELEREFGQAGEAAGRGFGADMRRFGDAVEGAQQALARGFLPVLSRVAVVLNERLSDPKTIANIEKFGQGLAAGLDSLISIAEKLPWDAIGTSLQLAGTGARAVLDAFVSLPPWVQTAVLTGWGLNKLTGGALTGIAGELIKGVAGQRGSSPANPLFVSQVGGVPGAGPGAAGGGLASAAGALGVGVVVLGVTQAASASLSGAIATAVTGNANVGAGVEALQTSTSGGSPIPIIGPLDRLFRALGGDFRSGAEVAADAAQGTTSAIGKSNQHLAEIQGKTAATLKATERAEAIAAQKADQVKAQIAAGDSRTELALSAVGGQVLQSGTVVSGAVNAVKTATDATKAAAAAAGQQTAAAIRDKDLSVDVRNTVNVQTNVSVRSTIGATQKVNKYTTIL